MIGFHLNLSGEIVIDSFVTYHKVKVAALSNGSLKYIKNSDKISPIIYIMGPINYFVGSIMLNNKFNSLSKHAP